AVLNTAKQSVKIWILSNDICYLLPLCRWLRVSWGDGEILPKGLLPFNNLLGNYRLNFLRCTKAACLRRKKPRQRGVDVFKGYEPFNGN
ncbi:hypothetical protein, partial [Xylella fastidiosa]|uniref:hypothetical protein n=1 Tax=Xylella fastidiosa TaxID=2371 RepID=UPI000A67AA68